LLSTEPNTVPLDADAPVTKSESGPPNGAASRNRDTALVALNVFYLPRTQVVTGIPAKNRDRCHWPAPDFLKGG
jgi:hypothetical protein